MPRPSLTQLLLGYCLVIVALLYATGLPEDNKKESPQPSSPLSIASPQEVSTAIANTLVSLDLNIGDFQNAERVRLNTPTHRLSIEHIALYLPGGLSTEAVVKRLLAIDLPGLTWRRIDDDTLKAHVESWVDGRPMHLITVTPSFDAKGPDPFGRPYPIALVIRGLGDSFQRLAPLLKLRQKYTLAINPFQTHSLQWGEEGGAAGKEIWVDFREDGENNQDIREHLEAVPNAGGMLLPHTIPEENRLFTLLHNSNWSALVGGPTLLQRSKNKNVRSAQPWHLDVSGKAWAERELSRLMALSVRDGCAIGLIDSSSTSLESLGFWIHGVERRGFRLVGAKEAIALLEELENQD